ncbi:MAG: AsmA family protein [Terracidiphilus sp.]
MTESAQNPRRKRRWFALVVAVLAALLAVVVVPPFIGVGRYKNRITRLVSASLGRPVSLSAVKLRLLPQPGFVLTDLNVEEDPAFGAEPVLHANTVTASIRLLSLWRGLEIGSISVDEASLNLVRNPAGRWNVESLFSSATHPGQLIAAHRGRRQIPLPYLEATNSRINIKNGVEKLPFSLIDADLSFWQEQPGEWRFRLRGQPARTDLNLDLADTGLVRLEADLHSAPDLRQMPLHVDAEWREAQLGQLTRLLVGSDAGWRGDLTGELELDGTPDAARIKARLSAANVHRAEFAPAEPMDFDANCSFVYHSSSRSLENVECNSPLGEGRVHVTGDLPGNSGKPRLSVELDRFPVDFALNALRTIRSDFGAGLEASGTISGKVTYEANQPADPHASAHVARTRGAKSRPTPQGPLTGSFTVQGFQLSGEGLNQPVRLTKMNLVPTLEPVLDPVVDPTLNPNPDPKPESTMGKAEAPWAQLPGLSATASIPAGTAAALTITSHLTISGYQVTVRGQASIARLRELAKIAGLEDRAPLDALTGGPVTIDASAQGPWLAPETIPIQTATRASSLISVPGSSVSSPSVPGPDRLSGTVTFQNVNWKADFLANPVEIADATLHVDDNEARWDPIDFSYGPVKGTATVSVPLRCTAPEDCHPAFQVQFGALDATAAEAAVLGARERGTLLSELVARLSPSRPPAWPQLEGTVQADSLLLGPVTLEHPTATLRIVEDGAEITSLDASLLGGSLHGTGTLHAAGAKQNSGNTPEYSLDSQFQHLNPADVGRLLGQRWSGGEIDGTGKIDLSGYAAEDLTSSAKGNLHFEWRHGSVNADNNLAGAAPDPPAQPIPAMLAHFDGWTVDAEVDNGAITLKQNEVQRGSRRSTITATVTLGVPPKIAFGSIKAVQTARR